MNAKTLSSDASPSQIRSAWLRASFLGPGALLVIGGIYTLFAGDGALGSRLAMTAKLLVFAPFAALLFGSVLVLVDLVLAAVRVRRRPTGISAWLSSVVAVIVGSFVFAIFQSVMSGTLSERAMGAVAFGTLVATAILARLVFGSRPARR